MDTPVGTFALPRRKLLVGALAAACASAALAPGADAAFTVGKCQGGSLAAGGASFQNNANQKVWSGTGNVLTNFCAPTAAFGVTYPTNGAANGPVGNISITGSGNGRAAFGRLGPQPGRTARDGVIRFVGTDEAPDPGELVAMEAGEAVAADDARLHIVPAAVGSVAVEVNWPDACQNQAPAGQGLDYVKDGTAATGSNPGIIGNSFDHTQRFRITRQTLEGVFAGTIRQWSGLGIGLTGACGNTAIKRIVRNDDSGTTFALKQYLDAVSHEAGGSGIDWKNTFVTGPNRTILWPGIAGNTVPTNTAGRFGGGTRTGTDLLLISNSANGNGELRNQLAITDGAIGYGAISDARGGNRESGTNGSTLTPNDTKPVWNRQQDGGGNIGEFDVRPAQSPRFNTAGAPLAPADGAGIPYPDDDRFMIPLQNANGAWVEPTSDANGWKNQTAVPSVVKGSNCPNAIPFNPPDPIAGTTDRTLSNPGWFNTTGVNAGSGYVACALTYILVWDDYAKAYAGSPDPNEEAHARSAKDYAEAIIGFGQDSFGANTSLLTQDYAPLPSSLQAIAAQGIAAIDWNKSNAGTGGGPVDPGTGGGPVDPGTGSAPPPAAGGGGGVSNAFSIIGSSSNARKRTISINVQGPGAGIFGATGTATVPGRASAAKKITVGSTKLSVAKAGKYTLTIKLSSAAKKALKKLKKLKVSVVVKYTPVGGTAASKTKSVTIKAVKARR